MNGRWEPWVENILIVGKWIYDWLLLTFMGASKSDRFEEEMTLLKHYLYRERESSSLKSLEYNSKLHYSLKKKSGGNREDGDNEEVRYVGRSKVRGMK